MEPQDPHVEFFQSEEDSQHYWRLRAVNGQIIATGGEGYKTEGGAKAGWAAVKRVVLMLAAEDALSEQSKIEEVEDCG